MTTKIESLNITLHDCEQKHSQMLVALNNLQTEWREAVACGESDQALSPIESAIDSSRRDVDRASIRVESARKAVERAEHEASQAEAKRAADAFIDADAKMRQALADADEAGRKYAYVIDALKPLSDAYFSKMILAKRAGSFPSIGPLPQPFDVRAAAGVANGTPAFLNSRASA